jgi:DNA invertase Pin-like site-specific DNA recombinase
MQPDTQQQRTTVLVYARRSKVINESDRFNVDGQLAALRAECTRRGYDLPPFTIEEYVDAKGHRSGRHEYTRPEWLKLRARLGAPDVLAVMFYTIDRASRSVRDFADLIEVCKAADVGIIALIDGVDTLAGVGRRHLDLHLRAMIAQDESDLASERMTRRIALKRQAGIPHGTPPFGTRYAGQGGSMRRVASAHAPAVVQLMQWYCEGHSCRAVMHRANAAGLLHVDRHGRLEAFKLGAVQTIIGNVLAYAGYIQHGPHTKRDHVKLSGEGALVDRYARAVGAVHSPAIEPIISMEMAEAVIERRQQRQRTGRPARSLALLTHALWHEGRRVYSAARHGGRYRLHGRGSQSWPIAQIDAQLLENLAGLRFSAALQAAIVAHVTNHSHDAERDALRARQRDYEARLDRVKDMYEAGMLSRADFQSRFMAIDGVLSETRRLLLEPTQIDAVLQQLTTLAETLMLIPHEQRRRAIYHLIERVEIDARGMITRVQLREWARAAFHQVMDAARVLRLNDALDRCSAGNIALDWWQRVAA